MEFKIILRNSHGGELDGRVAVGEEQLKPQLIDLINECTLEAGDVITIEEVA